MKAKIFFVMSLAQSLLRHQCSASDTPWRTIARSLIASLLIGVSSVYAADLVTQLELQHRLDYQVPLVDATFIGTHNSYNATDWGYPYPNHRRDPVDQLNGGFRVINYDVHTFGLLNIREILCHFAGGSSLTCHGSDQNFGDGLRNLNNWLENNPDEVVLLIIEDHINTRRHDEAANTIAREVHDKVYAPKASEPADGGRCRTLPVGTLTKQDVLDAGEQLIIAVTQDCSTYANWEFWVWDLYVDAYKGNEYSNVSRYNDKLGIVYEDRSIFGGGGEDELGGDEIAAALRNGTALLGLDMALSNDRRASAVWSWNSGEPNNVNNEDCAVQLSSGKWNDTSCTRSYRYACQSVIDGKWAITPSSGPWSNGDAACAASVSQQHFFSVPVNANDNFLLTLARATSGAGGSGIWLNYNDQAEEGDWVPVHFWNKTLKLPSRWTFDVLETPPLPIIIEGQRAKFAAETYRPGVYQRKAVLLPGAVTASPLAPVNGNNVQGLKFNGVNSFGVIEDSDDIDFGPDENFTVAVWIKVDAQAYIGKSDNDVVEKWSEGGEGYPYVFRYVNRTHALHGKLQAGRYDGTNNPRITSSRVINDGQFHHVAFVKDGETLRLYIDGLLDGETEDTTSADTTNTSPLFLGRRGSTTRPNWFTGVIDDLRIYPYAIDEDELDALTVNAPVDL